MACLSCYFLIFHFSHGRFVMLFLDFSLPAWHFRHATFTFLVSRMTDSPCYFLIFHFRHGISAMLLLHFLFLAWPTRHATLSILISRMVEHGRAWSIYHKRRNKSAQIQYFMQNSISCAALPALVFPLYSSAILSISLANAFA